MHVAFPAVAECLRIESYGSGMTCRRCARSLAHSPAIQIGDVSIVPFYGNGTAVDVAEV